MRVLSSLLLTSGTRAAFKQRTLGFSSIGHEMPKIHPIPIALYPKCPEKDKRVCLVPSGTPQNRVQRVKYLMKWIKSGWKMGFFDGENAGKWSFHHFGILAGSGDRVGKCEIRIFGAFLYAGILGDSTL